ncbi:uncharacterized protein SPPG_00050 [Spizellomyces punctatus DAOM BR117]|uniref:Uncharacterized protein n=1 Tax=Spizellomyces punctatus (strain DAOM BR117) TaxID=645134 RepID=A0A0L0HTX2_SPIPD|nr:uncharacterized protein SPPG_00050 [Spizellomyces punctatus DAOM BR117]KND04319.1 hypothetical protein SPPG_00050 [Spizellomyces punctatus DAOM BR117]|eukprot:XP_016612358.1 hypothetical protein SPPG_00050 [Spizellomyces punctatus DAOM BR117]
MNAGKSQMRDPAMASVGTIRMKEGAAEPKDKANVTLKDKVVGTAQKYLSSDPDTQARGAERAATGTVRTEEELNPNQKANLL